MSENTCACGQPAGDWAICRGCEARLTQALAETPAVVGELTTVLTRQTKTGGQGVGYTTGGGGRPLPYDPKASEVMSDLRSTLVSWTRLVLDENATHPPMPSDDLADIARWLLGQVPWLRLHDAAGDAVDEVTHAVEQARRLAGRQPVERLYRGPCAEEVEVEPGVFACCAADLYAKGSHASTAVCPYCGARHDAEGRRQYLRDVAGAKLYTRAELPALLKVLSKRPVAERLIDQWITHGRLLARGGEKTEITDTRKFQAEELLWLLAVEFPVTPCRLCGDDIVHTGKAGRPSAYCSEDCRKKADAARKRAA